MKSFLHKKCQSNPNYYNNSKLESSDLESSESFRSNLAQINFAILKKLSYI